MSPGGRLSRIMVALAVGAAPVMAYIRDTSAALVCLFIAAILFVFRSD